MVKQNKLSGLLFIALILQFITMPEAPAKPVSLPIQINRSWNFENTTQTTGLVKNVTTVQGIAGNAAVFNGYTSEWEEKGLPDIAGTFFIEAWVAPLEYSFNVSAIVNQQNGQDKGFLLGINQNGQLVGYLYAQGKPQVCISDEPVPFLNWSHVALSYQEGRGIELFINGLLVQSLSFQEKADLCPGCPLVIGKNQKKEKPTHSYGKEPIAMRFNGLIDELRISDHIPAAAVLQQQVNATGKAGIQAFQNQQMPSADIRQGTFGAYYTRLRYTEGWESLWEVGDDPDVVVRFPDNPVKYIFWRGTGYIPAIVSENNIWMSDQSAENHGANGRFNEGCYEAMGDKQCRYSHVRIIESTPARCVVHWRYALTGINNNIVNEDESGWGDWMDEYWTIYPDGVGIRKQLLHTPDGIEMAEIKDGFGIRKQWTDAAYYKKRHSFQETIILNQPGTKPQDNLEMEAIRFADMEGHTASYSWENGVPATFGQPQFQPIQLVNIKAKYKPFSIFRPDHITLPFGSGQKGYSTFPCWNHWPVAQIHSDSRNAVASDKPSHTSLTQEDYNTLKLECGADHTYLVRQMMGMTTEPIESLLPLARSWNNPPAVQMVSNAYEYMGYDVYQRAYLIKQRGNTTGKLRFTLQASESAPVYNPAFVIENLNNPNPVVLIDGKKMTAGKEYETGLIQTLDGNKAIFWIRLKHSRPVTIEIKPKM
ncbi:MAG: LamG domain-containing protein [Mediterranea sp.]|nr:LamG domain-containing protein [Mediterranea sp.]